MTYSDVPTLIAVVTFAADETSTSATHIARRSPADGAVVIGCHSSVPSSLPPTSRSAVAGRRKTERSGKGVKG